MDQFSEKKTERAVLVGLSSPLFDKLESSDWTTLDELEELLETAGGVCVGKLLQNRDTPDPGLFIGEGKAQEVKELAAINDAELVIFDNDLSPSQIRNLEMATGLTVLDRSALVLDIFAQRAQTSEGRLQVELAQYQYVLSKLSGMGKSMSRLGGGIGTRGPGESQLETDRRHIRRRISKLQEDFEKIRKVRGIQRERRIRAEMPSVAIVGYTNAGKSTLLNALTGASIQANDRLFDTLDPTTRKLEIDDGLTVLFTDTVGFIRKLPHKLIEAFKATLEELEYADVILHVIDLSDPDMETHIRVVEQLIDEFDLAATPVIRVYNKADKTDIIPLLRGSDVSISATTGAGLDSLLAQVKTAVGKKTYHIKVFIPFSDGQLTDLLYRESKVKTVEYNDNGSVIELLCPEELYGRLKERAVKMELCDE